MSRLRVLVLGGTSFVGRHLVDVLLTRGHDVTVFNRGRTAPGGLAGVTTIHGDREAPGGTAALAGSHWDVLFDTSCYLPRAAEAVTRVVAEVGHAVFVSSISVYSDLSRLPVDERAGVATVPEDLDALSAVSYAGLKVACERIVERAWPGRVTHVRAGIIVGPLDYDDRFPWLLRRVAAGGEMVAPGDPSRPVQLVDVRDLAVWMVAMAETRRAGVYNAVGPAQPLGYGALLEAIARATGGRPRLHWVPDDLLLAHGVAPYSELPFWLPPLPAGPLTVDNHAAQAAGLTFRPLDATVADTWRWLCDVHAGRDPDADRRRAARKLAVPAGLPPEREQAILAAHTARSGVG